MARQSCIRIEPCNGSKSADIFIGGVFSLDKHGRIESGIVRTNTSIVTDLIKLLNRKHSELTSISERVNTVSADLEERLRSCTGAMAVFQERAILLEAMNKIRAALSDYTYSEKRWFRSDDTGALENIPCIIDAALKETERIPFNNAFEYGQVHKHSDQPEFQIAELLHSVLQNAKNEVGEIREILVRINEVISSGEVMGKRASSWDGVLPVIESVLQNPHALRSINRKASLDGSTSYVEFILEK